MLSLLFLFLSFFPSTKRMITRMTYPPQHGIMTHLMAKSCTEIQTQPEPERLGISEFEAMCEEGNIRAEWIAFRCVGYDGALCDAFSAEGGGRGSRSHGREENREENSLKRKSFVKEEDEDDDISLKRVKRSDSL